MLLGNLEVDLGLVQYDSDTLLTPFPLAALIGLGAGAAVIILSVLVVILMYRYPFRTFMCFMCIYLIVIECLNHLYLPICIL